jgi:hypothetical protein
MRAFASVLVFLAVASPFITALSIQKGRFTFGEAGKYNYAHHVNNVPSVHWQGEDPANGVPAHATRKIFDRPATYEFGGSPGTYPVWYDPSYWYEGAKIRFNVRQQIRALARNLGWEIFLVFPLTGSLVSGLFVLFYVSGRKSDILNDLYQFSFLLVPAVSALGLYSLVHFETRYVASFVVVVYLCLFFSIHLHASPHSQRLMSAVAILIFLMFMSPIGPGRIPKHFADALDLFRFSSVVEEGADQKIVKELYRMGLQPGDHIASLTFSNLGTVTWARLARVKIVAEVFYWPDHPETEVNDFWNAAPATQAKVIEALAATGVHVIVSQKPPRGPGSSGWLRVEQTEYYIYWLHSGG